MLPGVKSFLQKGISACGHVQGKIKSSLFCTVLRKAVMSHLSRAKVGNMLAQMPPERCKQGRRSRGIIMVVL